MSNDPQVQSLQNALNTANAQLAQEKQKSEKTMQQAMKMRDQWMESQKQLRDAQSDIDTLNSAAARHAGMTAQEIAAELRAANDAVLKAKNDAATDIRKAQQDAQEQVGSLAREADEARARLLPQKNALESELRNLRAQLDQAKAELAEVKKDVIDERDMSSLNEYGLYSFLHPAMDSVVLERKLAQVRNAIKAQLKNKTVTSANHDITIEGKTAKESAKFVDDMAKLMIRAYNSDAENCVKTVKGGNAGAALKRLDQSKDQVVKLGALIDLRINNEYHTLRKQEIQLAAQHLEAKAEERELERERKAELKEQKRIEAELQAEKDKLIKEQQHYENAIAKMEEEAKRSAQKAAQDAERLLAEAQARAAELIAEAEAAAARGDAEAQARAEAAAAEAEAAAERQAATENAAATEAAEALARLKQEAVEVSAKVEDVENQAANQRAGYVYVISNIGAFGERVVKIGMTRRLDPLDRVKELGGASVPFGFDVHTLFFSDDAVNLENQLHKKFADRRVNLINHRREFFYVTPHEVKSALAEVSGNGAVLEFADTPDAEQFRASESLRSGGVPEAS